MQNDPSNYLRKEMKPYLQLIADLNPATAALFWAQAIESRISNLTIDADDTIWWHSKLLEFQLRDLAEEAGLLENHKADGSSRREVQEQICLAVMDVYRTAWIIPSMNVSKALPTNLARTLVSFALAPSTSIDTAVVVFEFLSSHCRDDDLAGAFNRAADEARVTRSTDHVAYVLNSAALFYSSIAYGVYLALNSPKDASEFYAGVELLGMREYRIKGLNGGGE
jgi:hypothetical protein